MNVCGFFVVAAIADSHSASSARSVQFVDVTQQAGIDFVHSIGDGALTNLVESVGSGAAFLDYDGDGFLDLYVLSMAFVEGVSEGKRPQAKPQNRLYRNQGDGTFVDVTRQAKVGLTAFSMGVAVGDYDGDGYPDIYVANYGENTLYRNNRNGTFTNVTKKAGVGDSRCSVGAAFLDYDNDGRLDLYVVNYITFDPGYRYYYQPDAFPGPLAYAGQSDVLYRNRGDGTFEDVTEKVGLFNPSSRGMGVAAVDINNDGYVDIFVANDAMANDLWLNEGGTLSERSGVRFRNVALESGVALNQAGEGTASMAGAFGDYDGDGLLDLFVPDATFKALYHNEGGGSFSDVAVGSGIAEVGGQYVSWASGFIDFDNDGDLDLFCVNGPLHHLYGEEDLLFENVGGGRFRDVSAQAGDYFARKLCGRGGSFGDYDNDGDIDIFIMNLNDRPVLLRNDGGNWGNYLTLRLVGTRSNRDGIGAVVKVRAGRHTQVTQQKGGGGYLSSHDARLHFGVGKSRVVDEIEIRWPSGQVQRLEKVRVNQNLTINEPQ